MQHRAEFEVADAVARIGDVVQAMQWFSPLSQRSHNPFVGRPAKAGRRERVTGKGACCVVVPYRRAEAIHTIFVLAISSQRESGDAREA